MRTYDVIDDDPDLSYRLRLSADWYGMSVPDYVRVICERAVDDVADMNQMLREQFAFRP